VCVILLSGAARVGVAVALGANAAYLFTLSRLDALAWGGLLAYSRAQPRWAAPVGIGLCVIGFAIPSLPLFALVSEWGAILISGAVVTRATQVHWLKWRPLTYLGTISYGLYVWHLVLPVILDWIQHQFHIWLRVPPTPGPQRWLYMTAASTLVASMTWFFFEKPFNDLKRRWPYSRVTRESREVAYDPVGAPSL
jgi:peptidoglycan/LPS O-acetylase OafA/YrhL